MHKTIIAVVYLLFLCTFDSVHGIPKSLSSHKINNTSKTPLDSTKSIHKSTLNLLNRNWTSGSNLLNISKKDGIIKAHVNSGTNCERWPNMEIQLKIPEDWSRFHTLHLRVRLSSTRISDMKDGKELAFCFYDRTYRDEMRDNARQQSPKIHIPAGGGWYDLKVPLQGVNLQEVDKFYILMYEGSIPEKYSYTYEFERIELEGPSSSYTIFDGKSLVNSKFSDVGNTVFRTDPIDRMTIGFDLSGRVSELKVNGSNMIAKERFSGILIRDALSERDPEMIGGSLQKVGGCVFQTAKPAGMGLTVEASYEPGPGMLIINGRVKNLSDKNRALTIYFALPLSDGDWYWCKDIRTKIALRDIESRSTQEDSEARWPIGSVVLPGNAGLTLGIRLDEPQRFRIGFHGGKRVLYIARDIALLDVKTVDGKSLNEADFSFILNTCDASWGYRSALEKYYRCFPEFFKRYTNPNGAWTMYPNLKKFSDEQMRMMGGRFTWSSKLMTEEILRCRKNGVHNLKYIEPEYVQISMGDYTVPGSNEAKNRIDKLATGTPSEIQTVKKLIYHRGDNMESLVRNGKAVASSCLTDSDGKPIYGINGQRDWLGDTKVGIMAECNLSHGIPDGRGQMTLDIAKEYAEQFINEHGVPLSGIALDCFGWTNNSDYDPARFPYAPCALTFEQNCRRPCLPVIFTSACWLKELGNWAHSKSMITFANLGNDITFMAPYIDVFAKECASASDPDYLRMLAFQRTVTFNPYRVKVAPHEIFYHMLYAIYPGDTWQDEEIYKRVVPVLDILNYEGWEPVTGAVANDAKIRIERYGDNLLVVHNLDNNPHSKAKITLDKSILNEDFALSKMIFSGLDKKDITVKIIEGCFYIDLKGRDTLVVKLTVSEKDIKK